MAEDRVKCSPIELALLVDPAAEHRIPHAVYIVEGLITAQVEPPPPHRLPHLRRGLIAYRRAEVDEVPTPSILRPSRAKRVSEKIKFLMGTRTPPVVILAVDDFRLVRMQFQLATF